MTRAVASAGEALFITSHDQAEAIMALQASAPRPRYAAALRDWGLRQTPPGMRRTLIFRFGILEIAEDREICIHPNVSTPNSQMNN